MCLIVLLTEFILAIPYWWQRIAMSFTVVPPVSTRVGGTDPGLLLEKRLYKAAERGWACTGRAICR